MIYFDMCIAKSRVWCLIFFHGINQLFLPDNLLGMAYHFLCGIISVKVPFFSAVARGNVFLRA